MTIDARGVAVAAIVAIIAGGLVRKAVVPRTADSQAKVKSRPEAVVPERMRYGDIPVAVKSVIASMQASKDPLDRYLRTSPDSTDSPWIHTMKTLHLYARLARSTSEQGAWSINHGEAFMILLSPPSQGGGPNLFGKILARFIRLTATLCHSSEEQKRAKEFFRSFGASAETHLGEREKDMYEIALLATAPEKQGHGYASTLVRSVIDKAENEGRAMWLGSTNVAANTGFYSALGFKTVDTFYVGGDNPTWPEGPLPMALMVREPNSIQMPEKEPGIFNIA